MRIPALMLATVILLAGSLAAQSTPAFISQFPPVDRVKVELKGADPMDTAARHMGAFWQLQQVIKQMSGLRWTRNQLTPEEKRLIGAYSAAYQAAGHPYASYPDRPKWYNMHAFYETSREFREELFQRFLSAGVRGQWAQTEAQTKATVEAGQRAREQGVREERSRLRRPRRNSRHSSESANPPSGSASPPAASLPVAATATA